jgi:hypothetical protein
VDVEDYFRGELSPNSAQSTRKARIRDDIAQRLRRVCSDLPETEFQGLVDEIADRQLRGERRNSNW